MDLSVAKIVCIYIGIGAILKIQLGQDFYTQFTGAPLARRPGSPAPHFEHCSHLNYSLWSYLSSRHEAVGSVGTKIKQRSVAQWFTFQS